MRVVNENRAGWILNAQESMLDPLDGGGQQRIELAQLILHIPRLLHEQLLFHPLEI